MRLTALIFGLLFLLVANLHAQPKVYTPKPGDLVKVVMNNGERFKGEFVEQNLKNVVLKTSVSQIELLLAEIKTIKRFKYKGSMSDPHFHSARYFFGPSALALKKKEAYYQTSYGLLHSIDYGITNNISVRGGFEVTSLISRPSFRERQKPFWYLNPKVSFRYTQDSYVSGGILLLRLPFEELAGYYYGSLSFGGQNANVTLGVGYPLFNAEIEESPIYYVSAMQRIDKRLVLISENYITQFNENSRELVGFFGIRYFRNKSAFEASMFLVYNNYSSFFIPPVPYVGYSRFF